MALLQRLSAAGRALFRPRAANIDYHDITRISSSEQLSKVLGRELAKSGIAVSADVAQGLAAFAAVERVLANSVAKLPLIVYQTRDVEIDGQIRRRKERARDLRIFRLLHDAPNSFQTSYQWRKLLMRDLLFRGRHYSLKVQGIGGQIQELIRLHPDRTKAKQDPNTLEITYEHRRHDGRTITYRRDEIFHVWQQSDDGVDGISPISAYRESIGDGVAIREHGSSFFANKARVGGILTQEKGSNLGPESRRALREDFEQLYAGNSSAHRTAVLPMGVDFKPVSISMEDAQWIEARRVNARELAGIFGVPPHKIGDLADATFSNIEHMGIEFLSEALDPWLVCLEQSIDRDLLNHAPTLFARFNRNAILRTDMKSRAEALQIMRRNGVVNANEWRETEDMNPIEDGEGFIIEQNMRTLGEDE